MQSNEFCEALGGIIQVHLKKNAINPKQAAVIAKSITGDMLTELGGQAIYLKNGTQVRVAEKHKQILADFNGKNHAEIYKKYGIGASWLQKLLKRAAQDDTVN
jgi:Mor family transcriptional regulator